MKAVDAVKTNYANKCHNRNDFSLNLLVLLATLKVKS
jgi:hypothetical protein